MLCGGGGGGSVVVDVDCSRTTGLDPREEKSAGRERRFSRSIQLPNRTEWRENKMESKSCCSRLLASRLAEYLSSVGPDIFASAGV